MIRSPTLQPNLLSIVLKFRIYQIALTTDVAKMYRQIRMANKDCDLQRICYSANTRDSLKDYRLLTVTYDTRSELFLATRCLLELCHIILDHYTQRIVQQNFYVDNLLSSCQN